MIKSSLRLPVTGAPATVVNVSQLNPSVVMSALGSPVRWAIVHLLADGRSQTISQVAAVVGGLPDTISKQLWVLQRAGVLECRAGEDRRQTLFAVPAAYRENPGVIDFGFGQLQFPDVLPMGKD
jgi:predicted transcriptional regulator